MDDIYQRQELLDILKNPTNKGAVSNPSAKVTANNPMCGDVVDLTLEIQDGKIVDAKFDGSACAVSVISSDLLADEIIGKTLEEAKNLKKEDTLALIGTELTTSRVKCATLVLDALHRAVEEYEDGGVQS